MRVEATTEVQNAARKVLEENRRLRALLQARGVPVQEIEVALGQPSTAPALSQMIEENTTGNGKPANDTCISSRTRSIASMGAATTLLSISTPSQQPTAKSEAETYNPGLVTAEYSTLSAAIPYSSHNNTSIPDAGPERSLYGYDMEHDRTDQWAITPTTRCAEDLNSTSCVSAARIIRTMQSDVGPELEADLGCRTPGQDCRVANPVVFDAIEKYSVGK